MHCRSCGADLPDDAEYCLRCGARVELGSVLGVGTDLPPVVPPAPPEDLGKTAEMPRLPVPNDADPVAQPAPAPPAEVPPQQAAPVGNRARGSGHSRGSILAMIATFVLLTLVGTFALTRIIGSGEPTPSATTAPPSSASASPGQPTEPTEPSATATSPSSGTPTTSTSPSPSASAGTTVPAGARRCSTSGSDAVATAYAGTERTSCEFAAAVREAYRKAGTPDGVTTLRAYSPVTKKWYSLSCDGGAPVKCTSTTNAIVLLAP